jgi:hypothetical protein
MMYVKQVPFWRRKQGLTAGEAMLLGLVIGCAVAVAAAFNPPRDFSFSFLWGLLLSIGAFSAFTGYGFWLVCDPVREQRLQRIMTIVVRLVLLVLLVAIPVLWGKLGHSIGPLMVIIFAGFVCATSMFAVFFGFGVVQLVGHAMRSFRRFTKPASASWANGVWDREFD